jgi:hypothetical protein
MEDVVLVHVPDWVSQAGEGVLIAVGATQATTHGQVEALHMP